MAITGGTKFSYNVGQQTVDAGVSTRPDTRRLFNFGDKVAELAPEESPFFVYLNKVSKRATDDPVFRFLENRSKIDWTSRNFSITTGGSAIGVSRTADSVYNFVVDDGTSASIDWLIKGMVFNIATTAIDNMMVRIESAPVDAGATTTFSGKVISFSPGTGGDAIADDDACQVIGTSFGEGSGSPDTWSNDIEDDYGYTQIFKTAAEMTNTGIATNYRGYANEWDRIWNLKLREHKVDIERAMLFSQRARSSNVQYSEGLVGHILKNGTAAASGALSYTSGKPYLVSGDQADLTYDDLLKDLEVVFDPARGGGTSKLCLASLPVITFFNRMGSTGFLAQSTTSSAYQVNMEQVTGSFGHKVTQVDTIHGTMMIVKEPLFRGISSGFMLCADMSKLAYRPLVGNGLNRDTHIITNVQQADEDLRKDMILTEAGLEIAIPETHLLYNFTDL